MRTSPRKQRVCVVLSLSIDSYFVRFCFAVFNAYAASQTTGLCSAFPFAPIWFAFILNMLCTDAFFASQTSGLFSICNIQ